MNESDSLFGQIERFVEHVFDRSHLGYLAYGHWKPPMDVYESDNAYIVLVDIPGTPIEQVHVSVNKGVLSIRGVRSDPSPVNKIRCHQVELGQGHFQRRVVLGENIDEDGIRARMKDGLLTIKIPKEKT